MIMTLRILVLNMCAFFTLIAPVSCDVNAATTSKNDILVQYFLDVSNRIDPQAPFHDPAVLAEFKPSETLSAGATKGQNWFLLELSEEIHVLLARQVLLINFTNFDRVTFHVQYPDGKTVSSTSGDDVPFGSRSLPYRMPNVVLSNDGVPASRVLIHAETFVPGDGTRIEHFLPIELVSETELQKRNRTDHLWYGFLFGALFLLLIYNLSIFVYLRESAYLWYCIYLAAFSVLIACMSGLGQQYLWPNHRHLTTNLALLAIVAINAATFRFAATFIGLSDILPGRDRVFTIASCLVLVPALLLFRETYYLAQSIMYAVAAISMALILWTVGETAWRGNRQSRYILASYLCLFPGISLAILRYIGIVPSSALVEHVFEAGIVAEAMVLSLGLADRINLLKARAAAEEARRIANEQTFSRRMVDMLEHEKHEMSAFLHDSVGHDLTRLRHRLAGSASQDLTGSLALVDQAIARLSASALSGSALLLRQVGLVKALDTLCRQATEATGIVSSFHGQEPPVSDSEKLHVYRIVQECLNNTLKHAEASEVIVRLDERPDGFELLYRDDGKGFRFTGQQDASYGFGLYSIQSRADLCQATLRIESSPGSGFSLTLNKS